MNTLNEDSSLRRTVKAFWWFTGVVAICMIAAIIMVVVAVSKVGEVVEKDGLRSVVERVWCGKNVSCLSK